MQQTVVSHLAWSALAIALANCTQDGGGDSIVTGASGPDPSTTATTEPGSSTDSGSSASGTTDSTGGGTSSDSDPTTNTDSGGGATTDGVRFDLDPIPDAPPGGDGCKKVDFLFVIDNSGSMLDEQQHLVDAFPGFIESIQNTVEGQDHHIMVVDSDESAAFVCEEYIVNGGTHCNGGPQQWICEGYPCGLVDSLGACDLALGGGVVHPFGGNTANMACGFPMGRRYLTDLDADLMSTFECAAKVGTSGHSFERPFSAMVAALDSAANGAGGCNEGFLRDDAVLVVTVLTDAPGPPVTPSGDAAETDPMPWYHGLVAAKNNDPDAVVVIGLIPTMDTSCIAGDVATPVFEAFMTLWGDNGVTASVCDTDYAVVFDDAVRAIDTACDDFTPPG